MLVRLHLSTGNAKIVSIPYEAVSILTNKLSAFCKGKKMEEIFFSSIYTYMNKFYTVIRYLLTVDISSAKHIIT